jgi:hypothetical protein
MSFEPPDGILDIGNATLRVGKLEVAETSGLNQGLLNIVKNNLLITENTEYAIDHHWGIKLPTTWVADFDVKGHSGKYVEFNFYNEGFTSNTSGYTLNFNDTSLTLKYDNGTTLASATIPTIVNTYRKVNIFFERNVIAVSIDGTRYLYDKRPSVLSRVISTTGSAFVNVFIEQDAANSKFKNPRIVNGRFISDQTSNIAFMGGNLGVGVNSPTESLDVLGSIKSSANLHVSGNVYAGGEIELYSNLNIQQVSNTATIKATSNVVTEFSRSKKFIKYPRVALTSAAQTESGYEGYFVSQDSATLNSTPNRQAWAFFDNVLLEKTGHGGPHFDASGARFDSSGNYTGGDSLGGISGDWMYIRLPDKIQLHSVDLWARITNGRNPVDATVLGSLNGTIWSVVGSWTGADFTAGKSTSFNLNSIQYYDYIGFVFEKIEANSSGGYVNFHEIELYGTPEYDPEAHGTDVTVKSYPNVPNTDWLEVYYDAKNYTFGVVQDETTNDRDGVLYGDTSLTSADGIHKFDFDGNGDYIKTTLTGFTGTTVTFSAWVFMDSVAAGRANTIMGLGSWGADGSAAWIAVGTDGKLQTGNIGLGSCASSVQASTLTKQWLHITGIVSSGDFRLYQDGQLINSTNTAGTINYGTNPVLYLATRANASGSPESTRYFDCKIANARLFNRALSSDEIYQLYAYQKEDFGHGALGMTLKNGRLGIGTSEPRAALDVRGDIMGGCPVLFRVNIQSASNSSLTPTSGAPPIVWNNVSWNVGGGYNSSTGIFTAPIQGYYSFSHWAMTNGNQNLVLLYYINGSDSNDLNPVRSEPFANKNGYSHVQNSGTTTFKMRAGDQLYIALTSGNIFVSAVGSAMYNNFEGYYLSSW